MLQFSVGIGRQRRRPAIFACSEYKLRLRLSRVTKTGITGCFQAENRAVGFKAGLKLAIPEADAQDAITFFGFDIKPDPCFQLITIWLRRQSDRWPGGTKRRSKVDVGDPPAQCARIDACQIA